MRLIVDIFLITFYIVLSSQVFVHGKTFEYEYKLNPSFATKFPNIGKCKEFAEGFIKSEILRTPKEY
jgi:hypothetical protein